MERRTQHLRNTARDASVPTMIMDTLVAVRGTLSHSLSKLVNRAALCTTALLLPVLTPAAHAQCPEGWLPGWGVTGTESRVNAVVTLADGDVILGGAFSTAGGIAAQRIVRFSPATGTWSPLGAGITSTSSTVNAVVQLPDGDLLIGGVFSSAGGVPVSNIVRYNLTTGAWTALGSGTSSAVNSMVMMPDGSVTVAGGFGFAGGLTVSNVARYIPAINTWQAMGAGMNGGVAALTLAPGGDVIAGGSFTQAGGAAAQHVARYHPATHVWSAMGAGADSTVYSLATAANGDIVAGGTFSHAGGVAAANIARYNPSTGVWSAMGAGITDPTFAEVSGLYALPNGDVLAGGYFTVAGGAPAGHVALYSAASGAWSNPGGGLDGDRVYAFAQLSNGEILAGGSFNSLTTPHAQSIARYSPAADAWSALPSAGPVTDGGLESVTQLPSGDVLVSGTFTQIAGVAAPAFARYEPITRTWSALPAPPAPNPGMGTDPTVGTTVVLPDGSVVATVNSTVSLGVKRTSVARFNPATGVWTPLGDAQGTVRPLALAPNGDVVVGGTFTAIGGVPAANIARLNLATGVWSPLGAGVSGPVYSLAVTSNGDVYVGGQFASAGGLGSRGFARFSAATNDWTPTGTEGLAPLPATLSLLVLPDGDLLLGGYFTSIGGVSASHVARYHPATGAFSALGSGTNYDYLSSLRLAANGKVLVGGLFSTAGGVSVRSLAWYDLASGTWSALASQLDSTISQNSIVYRAVPLAGGDVLAIGRFGAAGENVSAFFAHYTLGRPAPTIDSQPTTRSACIGGGATFSVSASGGGLSYQWLKGETPIDPAVNPSAATATLTLTGVSVADAGSYRVMVTRADGCGSVTSDAAQLFVDPSDVGSAGGLPGRDGLHDNNDFVAFIGAFFDGRPEADMGLAGGLLGSDGLFDNNDFIVFINEFFAALGC